MLRLLCMGSRSGTSEAPVTAYLFTALFAKYFKASHFKIILKSIENAPGHFEALRTTYQEIHFFSMPTNIASILQPVDLGIKKRCIS